MLSCSECNTSFPEGMRFCLQCGAPLAAAAPAGTSEAGTKPPFDSPPVRPAAPPAPVPLAKDLPPTRAAPAPEPTISLKIAPSVVIAPRVDAPLDRPRPNLGPEIEEIDEEALRSAFERPPVQPGTVVCRFCKGPLHLEGEYCEQCGAPVEDAAPPGVLQPQPAAPVTSPPATAPAPASEMAQPAPSAGSPVASAPARPLTVPPPAPGLPAARAKPMPRTPLRTRAPVASRPPTPKLAATEPPPGLVGRLKGLLKTKKVNFPVRHP